VDGVDFSSQTFSNEFSEKGLRNYTENKQMKFGINNIFTTFWFFAMLLSSGTLTYFSIVANVFSSDLFFVGKCIMGFIILLFTGIVLYVLYKFRIVFIDDTSITSIHPFLVRKQKIDLSKIKKIEINNFYAFQAAMYKNVKNNPLSRNYRNK
jgi:cell division septal protein FtsQ